MNMGIDRLVIVRPRSLEREKMLKMATHAAARVIEEMKVHDTLDDALAPFNYVIGTTARTGRLRAPTHSPRQMAQKVWGLLGNNKVALLFGSEKFGLSNRELRRCNGFVTIPTAQFSSINLAQSVMIMVYEIFTARSGSAVHHPRLASRMELDQMYQHLEMALDAVGLVKKYQPGYWTKKLRRILSDLELKSRHVRFMRGFCRHIIRSAGRQDG